MELQEIINAFYQKNRDYEYSAAKFKQKIRIKEAQLERLNKRFKKLRSSRPGWVEELIKPIAVGLSSHFPDYHYEILGPFGLGARVSIHFYVNGITDHEEKFKNCKSITFEPGMLERGELKLVDYTVNTGRYQPGSIGEMSGFNHPTIEIPKEAGIRWLFKFMQNQEG